MSNEHWGGLPYQLEESWQTATHALTLLVRIARTLNAGKSGDACYGCAKLRTVAALEKFFDRDAYSITESFEILEGKLYDPALSCERHQKETA